MNFVITFVKVVYGSHVASKRISNLIASISNSNFFIYHLEKIVLDIFY